MKVDLNALYSDKRTGTASEPDPSDPRSEYQKDFDRIVFSSPFRRLQNKTQVFPLPGSVFVHNRLTHSLEVSSVGRSLGSLIGGYIFENYQENLSEASQKFYQAALPNVIAAACLCHDIGNPAFGHSGEDAIAFFFMENSDLYSEMTEKERKDLVCFEGNANGIRVLTRQEIGKTKGGTKLTYSTLAAIAKYPCESTAIDSSFVHRKKFGFFQSEKDTFLNIAEKTGMIKDDSEPLIYKRHPFVWLVEAADDICNIVIDLEDAHRLKIIENEKCKELLHDLITCVNPNVDIARIDSRIKEIKDPNDQISYLRAHAINVLTNASAKIYKENLDKFLDGDFSKPILKVIEDDCTALKAIVEFSVDNVYPDQQIVEIENAGFKIMSGLLAHFIPPILKEKDKRTTADQKALQLVPSAFYHKTGSDYQKIIGVLDFISGMTDNFATSLYRKIMGIEIGMT